MQIEIGASVRSVIKYADAIRTRPAEIDRNPIGCRFVDEDLNAISRAVSDAAVWHVDELVCMARLRR